MDSVPGTKAKDGAGLILSGSSTLTSALLEHGLAEELVLLVNPVLGKAKRLFGEGIPPRAFAPDSTQALPSGIVNSTYKARWSFAEPEIRIANMRALNLGAVQSCEAHLYQANSQM